MRAPSPQRARAADRDAIRRLQELAAEVDGHPSLGDATWREIDAPEPDSAGFVVREPRATGAGEAEGDLVAYAHVARSDTFSPRYWMVGLVVRPDSRYAAHEQALLGAAVSHAASRGGGGVILWAFGAGAADDAVAAAAGFTADRDLLQMSVELPVDEKPRLPPAVELRTFEPGRDEADWLEVNNRAFGNHPEQGGWIEATLLRRMAEPWFDPSLFLVASDSAGLVGFNWLKVHTDRQRPRDDDDTSYGDTSYGEIFVIGVDPRVQGTGLGRALALAGLDLLHDRGLRTCVLYTDASNVSAVGLYTDLGFTVRRVDRAYRREVVSR